MPFGQREFLGLQHHEFGPTIPNPPSIDGFDAVPPVLSEEWRRLGKELSQCTGTEVVPRENIHAALLLYGVRHERTLQAANENLKKSRSGFLDAPEEYNENVKKFDSSLLLVGVRHEPTSASAADDNDSKFGSNLSLCGIRKEIEEPASGGRTEPIKRSASLPELAELDSLPHRNCSFSTSASDDMAGLDTRGTGKWSSGFFDDMQPSLGPRKLSMASDEGPSGLPKAKSVSFEPPSPPQSSSAEELRGAKERLQDMFEEFTSKELPAKEFPKIFRSPSSLLYLGPRMNKERQNADNGHTFHVPEPQDSPRLPPIETYSPRLGEWDAPEPATEPEKRHESPKPQQQQKVVQSLLQYLKPLQDQHSRLRQQQKLPKRDDQQAAAVPAASAPSPTSSPKQSPDTGSPLLPISPSPSAPRESPTEMDSGDGKVTGTSSPSAVLSPSSASSSGLEMASQQDCTVFPPKVSVSQQQQQLLRLMQEQTRKQEQLRQLKRQQQVQDGARPRCT